MQKIAVIGSTGLVGSNLITQLGGADGYNSKNIEEIANKEYDLVFCAGARAEKWKINQDPEADQANNQRLMENMAKVVTPRLVFISTVDVYPCPIEVDEDTAIDSKELQPYGLHHLELEQFCDKHFNTTNIRLPGLFGRGLKKNIIFDFLNDNNVDQINSESIFQFYYLKNILADIRVALENDLKVVNFATEPVSVAEIAREAFGVNFTNEPEGRMLARYDFRTKYAKLFGMHSGYIQDKITVLTEVREYVQAAKAQG